MAQQIQVLGTNLGRRVPPLLNLVLIVLIAVTTAKIIWLLWPNEAQEGLPPLPSSDVSNTKNAPEQTADFSSILNANIFGARANSEPSEIDPLVAPDTRLNLKLTGILSSNDEEQSRALIKDDSGKQRPYGIGDDIPGNAKLYSIHEDRVLLERAGRYETLRLEQDKLGTSGASGNSRRTTSSSGAPSNLSSSALASLSEVRDELLHDPTKAGQYIRVQPVYNQGQLQGYRVYPGKNRQLFKDVGLRAGEMVTSINGTQLDDPTRALQMLTELSSTNQMAITLERAGQSRTVNINLNQ
jgi:general secretion pathway protein C